MQNNMAKILTLMLMVSFFGISTVCAQGDEHEESQTINDKDGEGQTLLHKAVIKDDILEVQRLIEQGANLSLRDNKYKTPKDYINISTENGRQIKLLLLEALRVRSCQILLGHLFDCS